MSTGFRYVAREDIKKGDVCEVSENGVRVVRSFKERVLLVLKDFEKRACIASAPVCDTDPDRVGWIRAIKREIEGLEE